MVSFLLAAAVCLVPPVDGPIVNDYAPSGAYSGHWGIDYAAPLASELSAPVTGRVTFAGSVAGMRTLTIEPLPGFKVSLSYLATVLVSAGDWVRSGDLVATAGSPHGTPGVHMSTRINGAYVDPVGQLGCRHTEISRALRLVTPPQPYPRTRANRNSRRNVRPDTYRSPPRRRDSAVQRSRSAAAHARRGSLAKE